MVFVEVDKVERESATEKERETILANQTDAIHLLLTCNPAAQATSATPPMSLTFCGIAMRRGERKRRTGERAERERERRSLSFLSIELWKKRKARRKKTVSNSLSTFFSLSLSSRDKAREAHAYAPPLR